MASSDASMFDQEFNSSSQISSSLPTLGTTSDLIVVSQHIGKPFILHHISRAIHRRMEEGQTAEQQNENAELQEGERQNQTQTDEPKVKQVTFLEKPPRRIRKRVKGKMQKIRTQMEFYFGDANMSKDRFMKQELEKDPEGYIPLSTFLKFNKIKNLTDNADLLAKSLNVSEMLQVSEDGTKVRRTTPVKFLSKEEIDARTVYVEGFDRNKDISWLRKLFSKCGKVTYVSLPRFRTSSEVKGFAFIEFETPEEALRAVKKLNCVVDTPEEKPEEKVAGSIKQGKNLTHWKKRASKEGIDPMELEAALKDVAKGEGTEEESAKEGMKSKKSKKKKKKQLAVNQGQGADAATVQKTDQPEVYAESTVKEESKENTLKPEGTSDADDSSKVKKSKKSRKKRKRKGDPNKGVTEGSVSTVSKDADNLGDTVHNFKESRKSCETETDDPKVSGDSDDAEVTKSKWIEASSESDQGSRKRQRSRESSPVQNTEPTKSKKRKTKEKDIKDPDGEDDIFPAYKDGDDSAKDSKYSTTDDGKDATTGVEDSATESELQGQRDSSRKRKRGKDAIDTLQEKPSKPKKWKEGNLPSKRGLEEGGEAMMTEGKKKKKKTAEAGEEGNQKKKKLGSTSHQSDVAEEEEEEEGKKKKRKRHRLPEPTVLLRVMTKKKWEHLKKDYLEKQKANMTSLKEHLKLVAQQRKEQKEKQNKADENAPQFVPNAILEVRSEVGLCLQNIKADISPAIQVAYIDVKPSMTEGHIRLKDEASAKALLNVGLRDCRLSLVQGEAEKVYWDKLINDRTTKLSDTKRRKRRGKHKILQKAQNPLTESSLRQHFKFDDED